ncbi:isochorismate synthase, partial [Microbacterium sp. ISL-103]|nr:isochorismate synthase [Microbacterium sp. ISL-103]
MSSRLVVETREIDPVEDLLAYADPARPLAWLRRGDGIVAVGDDVVETIRVSAGSAPLRSDAIADAWRTLAQDADVDDALRLPGSGLVAFGALTFDEDSAADSVLIVPSLMIGRHRGRTWLTRIGRAAAAHESAELQAGADTRP